MTKVSAKATAPDFKLELDVKQSDGWPCAGVDEAGRGPLAGPVVAAAVILDPENIPEGLNDSKQLSEPLRDRLLEGILGTALAVSVCSVSAAEIDASDIRQATLAAMRKAILSLAVKPGHALIDGRDVPPGLPCSATAIIKGDSRSHSIAAASIVAKVLRDRLMRKAGEAYPEYGLERHAGYGTEAHRAAIDVHGGVERLHRFSFSPLRQLKLM